MKFKTMTELKTQLYRNELSFYILSKREMSIVKSVRKI